MGRKAVFLDRDGTLNFDPGYIEHPERMTLLPGVAPALKKLVSAGFELVIVTNQSGIARGIIPPGMIDRIHARMNELFLPEGVWFHHIYFAPYLPDSGSPHRKPGPQMLLDAARDLHLDLSQSFMVGDRISDLEAGNRAGVKASCLVLTGKGLEEQSQLKPGQAAYVGADLEAVTHWILNNSSN